MQAIFNVSEISPSEVVRVESAFGLPRFLAETLVRRGITEPDRIERFLNPSLNRDWRNPYDIPGMKGVVDALEQALDANRHIVVFGDFDLDGISATTVMTRGIRALGGRVTPFIPKRFDEGYGITDAAYERLRQLEPDVIVTVDCGISCKEEVSAILADGVEVIVTDHHEAGDDMPTGIPLCDPKANEGCPSAILAGVGVALKVIQALGNRKGFPYLWKSYTDFATLGTVADLMPMVDENRALVSDGLFRINNKPRPCIAALLAKVGGDQKEVTSTNLSFSIIPRLNAAGRMGDAQLALDLLMTDSFEYACELAEKLEEVNDQRRLIESELSEQALICAKHDYSGERALVVAGEGWHEGVKGIVASRLVNKYGVPAILFTIVDGEAHGSGRSVGKVNLYKAIQSVSDLVTKFGGHGAAIGVTLPADRLDEFRERLCGYMDTLPESEFIPSVDIDACVRLEELTLDSVGQIRRLAPFGQENPEPKLLARNVSLVDKRAVGADKTHLSCKLTDGIAKVSAIMFNCEGIDGFLYGQGIVDVAFAAQVEEYRGWKGVKAMLSGIIASQCVCDTPPQCASDMKRFIDGLYDFAVEGGCCCKGIPPEGEGAYAGLDYVSRSSRARQSEPACKGIRNYWESLAMQNPMAAAREIVRSIIGSADLHDAQVRMLECLERGTSILGVMATGRGKSLVFQVHAALLALREHKVSLFVYPLRALMADQAYHLASQFGQFGLQVAVLNGDTTPEERQRVYGGMADGSVDIVLTTPEYLAFNAADISRSGRVGFMVVDEAHHIGMSKAGNRPAYGRLDDIFDSLGRPVVLAVTATASPEIADAIKSKLDISESIVDDSSRKNLHVNDQRNIKNKDDYLAHVIAGGGKCVVYVNSREQSVGVARRLRDRLPGIAAHIGFYNAGLNAQERKRIESLFRDGQLQVMVSTSAFGEGIDIPDIRHVVLYHMPFNDVEFNQMSGRAGRDGKDAWIHLLYGRQDIPINQRLLDELSPNRDVMARIYRLLRELQSNAKDAGFFEVNEQMLASMAEASGCAITPGAASCGLCVFNELGLIDLRMPKVADGSVYEVRVCNTESKVELTDSIRYREGLDEQMDFREFSGWAMKSDEVCLTNRIIHPIIP